MPPFRIVPKSAFDTFVSSPGPTINGLTPGVEYVVVDEASVSGAFVPLAPPVAPSVISNASVSETDDGTSVTYTFTPASFAGTPTPTVTRVLTLDGVDVTGSMTGNVYVAAETNATQALVMTYTASNGVGSNATSVVTRTVPALPAPGAQFNFVLMNEAGATDFTTVPNLRVSLNGGTTWQTLAAAGLTVSVAPEGDALLIDGFSNASAQAPLFHYEQQIPGEPNSARAQVSANLPALYFRRVGGPAPINTTIPGMTVCATRHNSPVGVS